MGVPDGVQEAAVKSLKNINNLNRRFETSQSVLSGKKTESTKVSKVQKKSRQLFNFVDQQVRSSVNQSNDPYRQDKFDVRSIVKQYSSGVLNFTEPSQEIQKRIISNQRLVGREQNDYDLDIIIQNAQGEAQRHTREYSIERHTSQSKGTFSQLEKNTAQHTSALSNGQD